MFVCAGNANRSPEFEKYIKQRYSEHDVKSSGIYHAYDTPLKEGLEWAEAVFVMDLSQSMFIAGRYPAHLHKVHMIGVSDDYDRSTDDLLDIIRFWEEHYFKRWLKEKKDLDDGICPTCGTAIGEPRDWEGWK